MPPTTRQQAKAAQSTAPAPGASFEPFGRLPADIRQDIWRTAAAVPTCKPGIAYFETPYSEDRQEPRLVVHEPHNSNVLRTNTEAHDMALMTDAPTRPYNPETDILCITSGEAFENFTLHECSSHNRYEWVTKVRHLAIGLQLVDIAQYRLAQGALVGLSSLKTLSIVYPAASGTFDLRTMVNPPADRATPLRLLTEDEKGSLTIEADYTYNTWAGDYPVRWSCTVPEHVKSLEDTVDTDCHPDRADFWGISPLWDYDANRIAIRYIATCFEPRPVREKFGRQS
jgi:hypothetical protein